MANVGFIKGTKFIIPIGESSEVYIFRKTRCVCVEIADIGSFTCGEEQLIKTDAGWLEAVESYNASINGYRIESVERVGEEDTFDIMVTDDKHEYGIKVGDIEVTVHNIPTLIYGGKKSWNFYKYVPYSRTVTKTSVHTHIVSNKPKLDRANLIVLGGTFEKVGDADEVIGGGNQKVGSARKR